MRRERLLASPRGSARPPEYGTWTPRDRISEEDIAYDPAQFLFHTNPAANRRSRCLDPDVVSCLRAAGRGTAAVLAFAPTPLLSALSSVSVLACLANTHTHTHTHTHTYRPSSRVSVIVLQAVYIARNADGLRCGGHPPPPPSPSSSSSSPAPAPSSRSFPSRIFVSPIHLRSRFENTRVCSICLFVLE